MHSMLRSLAAFCAVLFLAVSAHAQAHEGHLPQVDGVIKKVDAKNGALAIAHGPIPNLNMPPMTMSFKAKDPAMTSKWKEGDKIRFRCADVKGTLTVVSIEAAQ